MPVNGNGTKRKEDKSMNSSIKTLAALLMVGAAFAACSSSDDSIIEQPVNPTEPKTYTMTIQASKGDDATTRGLYWNNPNTYDAIKVLWREGEKVRVVQNGQVVGTLTSAASETGETTLTGTLTGVVQDGDLQFFLHADENCKMDYTGQFGGVMMQYETDGNIEYNYDFAEAELTRTQFRLDTQTGTITNSDNSQLNFTSKQAIVRFELFNSDGSANVYAQKLIVSDANTGKIVQSIDGLTGEKTYGPVTHTPEGGQRCIFFVALNVGSDANIVLDAVDNNGNVYAYNRSHVTFEPGKYYKVNVKMNQRTQKSITEITPEDTYLKGWYVTEYGTVTKEYDDTHNPSSCYAVVAYVGKVDHYFDNFIALGLKDSKKDGTGGIPEYGGVDSNFAMNWSDALKAAYNYDEKHHVYQISSTLMSSAYDRVEYHVKVNNTDPEPDTYPTNTATGAARQGWRLPTVTDWRYVFEGLCGSPSATDPVGIKQNRGPYAENTATLYSTLNSKARNMVESGCYWTGSDEADTRAWYFSFNQESYGVKGFFSLNKEDSYYVRPVFAY